MALTLGFKASPEARKEIGDFIRLRAANYASWGKIQVSKRDKDKTAAVVAELTHIARTIESGEL